MGQIWPRNINQIRPLSGVEFILNRPFSLASLTQDERAEYAKSLHADQVTFERYRGVKQLRFWEALALHHYLDPDRLFLNQEGRWNELKELVGSMVCAFPRFMNFYRDLRGAVMASSGREWTWENINIDPIQRFVSPAEFLAYAKVKQLFSWPPELTMAKQPPLPKFVQDQFEGCELWEDYSATKHQIAQPNLVKFFSARGYSNNLSKAMATLCRPIDASKGRPPKLRNTG